MDVHNKERGVLTKGICLLDDGAKPHMGNATKQLLYSFRLDFFLTTLRIPLTFPSVYHFFTSLMVHIGGKIFSMER